MAKFTVNDPKTIQDSLLARHRNQILEIAKAHGALRPRVFGSRAAGQGSPESDLDILVQMDAGRDLLDLIAVKQELEELLNCSVDVVTERSLSPHLKAQILSEARAL